MYDLRKQRTERVALSMSSKQKYLRSWMGGAIAALGLALLIVSAIPLKTALPQAAIQIGGIPFAVEVAATPADRQAGLMGRNVLPVGHGMLFIYPDEADRHFWMKDTPLSLDILFFGADKRLLDAVQAQPCTTPTCEVYSSSRPAAYVVELPAGTVAKMHIQVGGASLNILAMDPLPSESPAILNR